MVASIRVAGGILGIFLVQKLPRVKLNMVMMTVMSLTMAALGSVLYVKEKLPDCGCTSLDVIPVIAATLNMFCFGAGEDRGQRRELNFVLQALGLSCGST